MAYRNEPETCDHDHVSGDECRDCGVTVDVSDDEVTIDYSDDETAEDDK